MDTIIAVTFDDPAGAADEAAVAGSMAQLDGAVLRTTAAAVSAEIKAPVPSVGSGERR
jgi:hypothetical protein